MAAPPKPEVDAYLFFLFGPDFFCLLDFLAYSGGDVDGRPSLVNGLREIKDDACDEPKMKDIVEWASKPNTIHLKPLLPMVYYLNGGADFCDDALQR